MANSGPIRNRDIEYQKQEYEEKNNILAAFGERVTAQSMYEDIFPDLEMLMPIIIADEDEDRSIAKMPIYEAINQAQGRNDMFMGCTSFFNEFVNKQTAKNIYSFVVDMDNVYAGILRQILASDWKTAHGKPMPRPTYIVNSGTGLHLYFLLDRPLPHYTRQEKYIDQLYRKLAATETTSWNFLEKSIQWFGQDFRIAGGCGKNGFENIPFKIGEPWNVDKLAAALGLKWKVKNQETGEDEDFSFLHEDDPRPQMGKQSEEAEKKRHKKAYYRRTGYFLNRRVYESSVERCKNETHEGHRYMSMCALSVLAWKCRIPEEQLRHDLLSLLPYYNNANVLRLVKPKEIESAIKMYNQRAMNTLRETLENWLGWQFKGSKRNGRRQWDHLHAPDWYEVIKTEDGKEKKRRRANLCKENRERAIQDMIEAGELHGRPPGTNPGGRPTKAEIIARWRDKHPTGRKIDCQMETGLSRPTILKWWDQVPPKKNLSDLPNISTLRTISDLPRL